MPRGRKPNYKGRSRQFNSGEDIERQMKDDAWRKKKEEPEDDEEENEDSDEESGEEGEKKGNSVIEVENPNRAKNKLQKADDITAEGEKPELSRREREAIEKEQARQRYEKLHAEGKTDEARADLARLAIIRKQREEAAKKKQQEKEEKDAKLVEAESARKQAMEAQLSGESSSGRKKKNKR